jgi:hypothetical protein
MRKSISDLNINPKKIASALFGIVLFLTFVNLVGQYYKVSGGDNEFLLKIIVKFNLDLEKNNIPTWYQSSTLLLSSFLLAVIAFIDHLKNERDYRFWGILSVIFLYISFDEAVSIHEQMILPLRHAFELKGFFYLSWVIPAKIFLVVFFFVFLKFLLRLPPSTRFLTFAAGGLYVFGALGVEMLGGNYLYVTNDLPSRVADFRYILLTTVEEFLEMSGICVFIYGLLTHLVRSEAVLFERRPATVRRAGKFNESISLG